MNNLNDLQNIIMFCFKNDPHEISFPGLYKSVPEEKEKESMGFETHLIDRDRVQGEVFIRIILMKHILFLLSFQLTPIVLEKHCALGREEDLDVMAKTLGTSVKSPLGKLATNHFSTTTSPYFRVSVV